MHPNYTSLAHLKLILRMSNDALSVIARGEINHLHHPAWRPTGKARLLRMSISHYKAVKLFAKMLDAMGILLTWRPHLGWPSFESYLEDVKAWAAMHSGQKSHSIFLSQNSASYHVRKGRISVPVIGTSKQKMPHLPVLLPTEICPGVISGRFECLVISYLFSHCSISRPGFPRPR